MPGQLWEYLEIHAWAHDGSLQKMTTNLGSVGWEAISVTPGPAKASEGGAIVLTVLLKRAAAGWPEPDGNSAGPAWLPDPTGRHTLRYWDRLRWTEHVRDGDTATIDYPHARP
ncbi:MAG: DUF2510 domain-containing protein [Actinomycetota bacterium]|nr:DUF2510 domain-containing protein [Actinomycetota bacterium]